MEYERKKTTYDSDLDDICLENDAIDELVDRNMAREVRFGEFMSDVSGNRMPGDYFNGLFIREIDCNGNKSVFISLTGNEYESMDGYTIKSIEPGRKERMKMVVEYGNEIYFVYKDKEEKYHYQRFF